MIVYYRMCDIPSTNPSPIFQENKFKLNELCLRSFVKAFKDIKPKVVFLNDFCDGRYNEMEDRIVPFDKDIIKTEIGINATCLKQYDLFLEQNEHDEVLFLECDYFWVDSGKYLLDALKTLQFVSPYDHPDKYELNELSRICYVGGRHWKSTSSTTSTFATRRPNFELLKDLFYKHGYIDKARWEEIGSRLYTPIPTLATHMVKSQLAPGITYETFI